jgi:hypothetical protein
MTNGIRTAIASEITGQQTSAIGYNLFAVYPYMPSGLHPLFLLIAGHRTHNALFPLITYGVFTPQYPFRLSG